MGDALKAEKIARHFAAVASPSLAATPFGKRAVPTLAAVDFSRAINTATRTYGNSAPLFLLTSMAPNATGDKLFIPAECLLDNKVEISFATAHGHMGTIISTNAPPVPAAINCGVLSGPNADCSAEMEALLRALAEKMAAEFKSDPIGFLRNFSNASDKAALDLLKSQGSSFLDGLGKAYDWAVDKTSQGIEYVMDGGAARDIASAADYVSSGQILSDIKDGAVAAYEWGREAIDTLRNLDMEELTQAFMDWLREMFGDLQCSARDMMAAMLADPRPIASQMGEVYGTAKVVVAEAAAAAAVDVFISKGAASAATRLGSLVAKAGPRIGKLTDKIGDLLRRARRKPDAGPDKKPHPAPKKDHTPEKPPDKDAVKKDKDGDADRPCLECPSTGTPVNTIFGCKILGGDDELDFVIDSPLPLVWQRNYASSNAYESYLGHGWTVPFDFRIDVEDDALVFVEAQGRRVAFPMLSVGDTFFSRYEHIRLHRSERNRCDLTTPDGTRLVFGLCPRDFREAAGRDSAERAEAAQFDQALETLHRSGRLAGDIPAAAPAAPDRRPPQAQSLVLLGVVDPNGGWIRVHYVHDDLPHVMETSDGRHVGFHFDPACGPGQRARLRRVSELLGDADEQGRFPSSRPLIEYRYSEEGDLVAVVDDNDQVVRKFAWSNHMLVEHAVPGGLVSRYEWDSLTPQGRVLANILSTGEHLRFDYDPLDRVNRVTDASGRVTAYRYDDRNYFTGLTTPDGAEWRYARDIHGNLLGITDPLGRTTRYTYDQQGRLLRIAQPDGGTYLFRYEDGHRSPVAVTDPLGQTAEFRYDDRGNLIEARDEGGAVTRYALDGQGRPVRIIDARGGENVLSYDRSGRLVERRDCLGQSTRHDYDAAGNVVRSIDPLGGTTHYQYRRINRQDRVVAITTADGATERFGHDALGRLVAHVDAAGHATRYALAPDGRPLTREDAAGRTQRYRYDVHGRLTALVNENGATANFAWDAVGRLVAERGFDGRRIDYRYNLAGELVESADGVPDGQPWMAPGQEGLIRVRFQRDAAGRLTDKISSVPGAAGREDICHNRYTYNIAGRLIGARNRESSVALHYTPTGLLARQITRTRGAAAATLEHVYDGLGNCYQTTLPDGRVLRHHLYGSGHVDRISLDDTVVSRFERDALHRETVRQQGALQTFFERDAVGRIVQQTVRSAAPDRPAAEPRIARQYRYDSLGQLLTVDDARIGRTSYRYDPTRRLLAAAGRSGRELFAFDPAGNLLDGTGAGDDVQAAMRRQWTDAEWQDYVEANIGREDFNPLRMPDRFAADPGQWPAAGTNRLAVFQQHRYRYDRWGNCVEKRSGAQEVRAFEWNAEHRLRKVRIRTARGVEQWGYDYDPFGRRIAKYRLPADPPTDVASSTGDAKARRKRAAARLRQSRQSADATHYTWDDNRLLLEDRDGRRTLHLYEPGTFVPLALVRSAVSPAQPADPSPLPHDLLSLKDLYPEQWAAVERRRGKLQSQLGIVDEASAPPPPFEIFHVHADHLGTPRELTDADGHLVWAASYRAWGAAAEIATPPRRAFGGAGNAVEEQWLEQADPVSQNLRFQGQYFDAETGLHYNRYRYYDPDCGRFVSQDPVGLAGGMNPYLYAPNPTQWIDPSGLCSSTLDRNLGGTVGDGKQAHHLIPEEIWGDHQAFFDDIGMGGQRDKKENGLLMPASAKKAKQMKRKFYHCGSHGVMYSPMVNKAVTDIEAEFRSGAIDAAQARGRIGALQQSMRGMLSAKGTVPVRLF
ncbi:RHS repeat-associated core domain-containing protein [Tahibacter caeni]|uniref:RHS repeat-associated core domain-containing protein n=1 Tax=Tahibacter caeni TaxID=1453545 RepID=UPI002149228F|nr:RHS repeat-associated core domain-containing protein [Tahibacter caeni]